MSQELPTNNSEWIKDTTHFNKDFIKKTKMKKVMKDIFLKLIFNILKNQMNLIMIYNIYWEEWKLKKLKSLMVICTIKLNIYTHKKFKASIRLQIGFKKKYIK